jgi:ABC-type multidrug transport system permease subunit
MRFLWSTALKDLRLRRRDPLSFALWIGIPLMIGSLIILASGGSGGAKPQAHLFVVDEDDSFVSRLLIGALSQEAAGGMVRAESVEYEAGRERLDGGEGSALLVIPEGFSNSVLLEEPCTLRLLTNPAQSILPAIVEESLSVFVDAIFYLQRLLGDEFREIAAGPPPGRNTFTDPRMADFSVRINQTVERLFASLNPPLIKMERSSGAEEGEPEEERPPYGLLFLPGILFMSILFMAQGLSDGIWEERGQMTLRRVLVSPQSRIVFLTGKLLAGMIVMAIVAFVGLAAGFAYLSLGPGLMPAALLWAVFSGAMLLAGFMFIQLLAPSQRAGNIIAMAFIFPLMMIGGSFFPFEAMPGWMAAIGKYTPNGWALERLKLILLEKLTPGDYGTGLLILCAATLILFLLSALRLRRGFAEG